MTDDTRHDTTVSKSETTEVSTSHTAQGDTETRRHTERREEVREEPRPQPVTETTVTTTTVVEE